MGFGGVVLTGGASRRMGTDKALLDLDGAPLVERPVAALVGAGADAVLAVGGDVERLAALGMRAVPDDHPGDGPLGGVLTGLAVLGTEVDAVVVAACDLPEVTVGAVTALAAALGPVGPGAGSTGVDAVVPIADGVLQTQLIALRSSAAPSLRTAFVAGERSLWRALADLGCLTIEGLDGAALVDLDSAEDLSRYAARRARARDDRPTAGTR